LLARTIAKRTSAAFFQVNGPEIVSKHYGESEAALRKVFEAASKAVPAIIFIDEIDAIAPKRDGMSGEKQLERRVVAQLLTLMDGLSDRGGIIVMAATNLPDSLDAALRRPGRFDREILFTPPTATARRAILDIHFARAPLAGSVDLDAIAAAAHGYVGADLAALAREASLAALDRAVSVAGGEDRVRTEDLYIEQVDLLMGLRATSPSALRETTINSPAIGWDDIGGLEDIKDALISAVVWPLIHRKTFASLNLSAASGVLLSGPPGTGKTLMARALAQESGMNFIAVRPTQILSQFLGEAERAVATIFARARQSAPTLIFFDELDTLAPRRNGKDGVADRIVAQLLTEVDGVQPNDGIVVLGATNRPAAIDPALLRAGRFEVTIMMPLPDSITRDKILRLLCKKTPCHGDVSIDDLVARTTGFSGADLTALVNGAARHALSRALRERGEAPQVTTTDFDLALQERHCAESMKVQDFIQKEI
jgi:transitional endoplasmic reticulum ATPase